MMSSDYSCRLFPLPILPSLPMPNYHHPHICQCLTRLAALRRDFLATVAGTRRKSGPELAEGVLGLARGLRALGLGSGDVVVVAALNSDLYLEWILAIAFVGGIVAPLNYRWSFEEAVFAMRAVRPVMLVTDESCRFWSSELRARDPPLLRWRVSLESSSSDLLTSETIRKPCARDISSEYSWAPENAVLICFTSGTTGRPKGVAITHSSLIVQSLAKIAIVGYNQDDVYLHTAPLCHIGGLSSAIAMLLVGACHVLIPKFEAKAALEAAKRHRVTSLITVPAMMADLISSARRNEAYERIESVSRILNGGGGLSDELIEEAPKLFPRAKIFSAYGMTEACSSLTFMTLFDPTLGAASMSANKPPGVCVGKPAPHVEIKISVDDASLNAGKILTRGPHVMLRYWGQTSSHSSDQQWLDTGDIGFLDECGDLWLLGRKNGRIKSGGENVYPEEVEAILLQHPGVLGVVVVGIPDARLTEMVVACVRVRQDWHWSDSSFEDSAAARKQHLSGESLQRFCGENNLARFKIPKKFYVWKKPFPLTTSGKVLRQEVQREVESQLQSLHSNL